MFGSLASMAMSLTRKIGSSSVSGVQFFRWFLASVGFASISFVAPTLDSGTITTNLSIPINISITNAKELEKAKLQYHRMLGVIVAKVYNKLKESFNDDDEEDDEDDDE
jgi:hypothetical protein